MLFLSMQMINMLFLFWVLNLKLLIRILEKKLFLRQKIIIKKYNQMMKNNMNNLLLNIYEICYSISLYKQKTIVNLKLVMKL
jgi:hypothetical protein